MEIFKKHMVMKNTKTVAKSTGTKKTSTTAAKTRKSVFKRTAYEIRLAMSQLGWQSHDKITWMGWGDDGKYGFSIWFERWDWHGNKKCDRICFHASTDNLSKIDEVTLQAANLAISAWEQFPTCKPRQDVNSISPDTVQPAWAIKPEGYDGAWYKPSEKYDFTDAVK